MCTIVIILLTLISFNLHGQEPWTEQNSGVTVDLYDILFINENVGWASGDSGTIIHTTDGGITWNKQETDVTTPIAHLQLIDDQSGFVISQKLLLSLQEGENKWSSISLPDTSGNLINYSDLCIVNSDTMFILYQKEVLRSFDGGNSWDISYQANNIGVVYEQLNSIHYSGDGILFLSLRYHDSGYEFIKIFKSSDHGMSWNSYYSLFFSPNYYGYARTVLTKPDTLWIVANEKFCRITNSQEKLNLHFIQVDMSLFGDNYHYPFSPRGILPLNGHQCMFSHSIQNGSNESWWLSSGIFLHNINSNVTKKVYSGKFNAIHKYQHTLWAVADSGKIFHNNTIITSIDSELQLTKEPMLIGNYPNPFNTETIIEFTTSRPGNITLKIYNIQGREVKTLTDKMLAPGLHRIRWDGTNSSGQSVSAGIYIYGLSNGDQFQSGKMILLK